MNTYTSKTLLNGRRGLWQRFQIMRAMRLYARIILLQEEADRLMAKANKLIRENSIAPAPLFDRLDKEGG